MIELDRSILTAEGFWGIEREAIRTDPKGYISALRHPDWLNPHSFSRDFSECQLELVTGVHPSIAATLAELESLHATANTALGDQLLWPLSMPPLPDEYSAIYPAVFPPDRHGQAQEEYRRYLQAKYGTAVMQISGMHINYSYPPELLRALNVDDNDQLYMRAAGIFLRFYPLLLYAFGASPQPGAYLGASNSIAPGASGVAGYPAVSLRNSRYGYRNPESNLVSYRNLAEYTRSIRALIGPRGLNSEKEVYAPLRLKPSLPGRCCETALAALDRNGVAYLEIRIPDLNPYSPVGIQAEQLQLLGLVAMYAALNPDVDFRPESETGYRDWLQHCEQYALEGRRQELRRKAAARLSELYETAVLLDAARPNAHYSRLLDRLTDQLDGNRPLLFEQVYQDSCDAGSQENFAVQLARRHKQRYAAVTKKEISDETQRCPICCA